MQIETIQELVSLGKIVWTKHAKGRIKQREIAEEDVYEGIFCGEIIEFYPNDYPFPSCLIWSKLKSGRIIHSVVGFDGSFVYIISVYIPDATKFAENFKIRRAK